MATHVNRSSLRYTLKCDKCNYRFATEFDLVSHACPGATKEGFSCKNCKFVFDSIEPLNRHLKFCDYPGPDSENHVCRICGDIFKSRESLRAHDLDAHTKNNQFKCKYCQTIFTSHRNMAIHERVHEREPVSCSICKCHFMSFASLKVHVWQVHRKRMSSEMVRLLEKCKICFKYFDKDRSHVCLKPPTNSTTSTNNKSTRPLYRCKHCDYVFFKYSNFEAHMHSHDVGDRSGSVDQPATLKRSTDSSSSSSSSSSSPIIPTKKSSPIADPLPVPSERPYRCYVCGCRFKYDFSLAAHVSSHNTIERKVIDEFAKIIQSHEEGEGSYVIEAIDVEDLRKQSTQNSDGDGPKNRNGLLNLLMGHFPDEDLSALGLFGENPSTEERRDDQMSIFAPIKIEPLEDFELKEFIDNQKSSVTS